MTLHVLGRVLGVDLGEKRIGVAVSDSKGTVATPYETVARSPVADDNWRALLEMARDVGAERVVVGLPLSLSGQAGPRATEAMAQIESLSVFLGPLGIAVETFDERFTSVTAQGLLRKSGVKGRAMRKRVDASAAAVILQAWLDSRPDPGN